MWKSWFTARNIVRDGKVASVDRIHGFECHGTYTGVSVCLVATSAFSDRAFVTFLIQMLIQRKKKNVLKCIPRIFQSAYIINGSFSHLRRRGDRKESKLMMSYVLPLELIISNLDWPLAILDSWPSSIRGFVSCFIPNINYSLGFAIFLSRK